MEAFYLLKRIEFLLLPYTWAILLLLWAAFTRQQPRRMSLLRWALGILLVFSNSFLVDLVLRWWEARPIRLGEVPSEVRVAVLLGGGLNYDKAFDRVNYGRNADRYMQALEPYRALRLERIIVSGGAPDYLEPGTYESDMMRRFLLSAGVAEQAIITERESLNTHQNAQHCAAIVDGLGNGPVLLITSAIHMRRAAACFRAQGVDIFPYPVQKSVGERMRTELDYLLVPRSENFRKWEALLHELVGFGSYRLRGYC